MNLDPTTLPPSCDVLVVGAGPAGSAAAQLLARGGHSVVLVDAQAFPRDKVCGDGLIPDAHRALARLGVLDAVMAEARSSTALTCIAPRGGRIDVPGRLAVLPRKRLDDILCRAAVAAGARMFAPLRFVAPLRADGDTSRVVGARLKHGDDEHEIRCRWLVLATGAQPQATIAAGVCERRTPSGVALRGYVRNARMSGRITSLEVVWHKRLSPGYGWIFPCGGDLFNVGVGVAQSHAPDRRGRHAMKDVNLREVFASFQSVYAPARELVASGEWQADAGQELKGAPLRCSLTGAALSARGLLITGEAAGSTYAFTGEGIGKAMETGMHAAEAVLASGDDASVRADYEARVRALKPRFDLYEEANRANAHPWLIDLLVWSAKRSPRRVERMAGVLEETHIPTDAVTVRGVLRRLFDPALTMCQLLGMNANTPTDVMFSFTGFATRAEEHKDGFGIAFFEGAGVRLLVDAQSARSSPIAAMVRRYPIKSENIVAHIRKATQGRVALENTHPFVRELWGRYWVFAHNGDLKDFSPRLHGAFRPVGGTDSERAFCWLMQELAKAHAGVPEIDELTATLAELMPQVAAHGVFNAMLSNGQALWAHCSTKLHHIVRQHPFTRASLQDDDVTVDFAAQTSPRDRVAVVVTEPLTKDESWLAFAPGEMRVFVDGAPLGD